MITDFNHLNYTLRIQLTFVILSVYNFAQRELILMQKIDFGDLNKFLVSTGIVLIVLAVLIPYLYFKEDFGLYIDQNKVDSMEESVQQLITTKRKQVVQFQNMIPYMSISLTILGLVSVIIGLVRWFKRQSKIDEKFDKELKKLDLELTTLTQEEQIEKATKAASEIENLEGQTVTFTTSKTLSRSDYVNNYIEIENRLTQVFLNFQSPNFNVLSQQRIGKRFDIDILLQAKTKRFLDRIVDVKYFKNRLSPKIISDTVYRLNTQISYYREASSRRVVPVVLVVYNKETTTPEDILKFRERMIDESQEIPNLDRLKIEFIEVNEIESFDVRRIIKK